MLEFRVSRRGAAVIGLWITLICGILCFVLRYLLGVWAIIIFLVCGALALTIGTAHFAACSLRCGAHHITVRSGILLCRTQRMPLKYISGCVILRSPLQRLTSTCVLILTTSGTLFFVWGAPLGDAERLSAHITYERGAL